MHLTTEEALDLIEKKASRAQTDFWNAHILTCTSCGHQLQTWLEIRDRLHRQNLESAPALVIHAAGAIFEPRARKTSLREVIASVLFDSFSQPALAGARGSAAARQLLLSAEEFDVHLRISTVGGQRRIAGQILSRGKDADVTGTQLHLLHEGKRIESAEADRFGEFEFHEIAQGQLELEIELWDLKITGNLNLG
jgi:hypothetical protein